MTTELTGEQLASFDASRTSRIGRDRDALTAFYRAYYDPVMRFLTSRINDPADVADLAADTFERAMAAAATFDPCRGRPLPWLLGIANNAVRRFYRGQARAQQAAQRYAGRRLLNADDLQHIEERIDAQREARAALDALGQLSSADRDLVELVDLAGLSPSEAARVLGMLPGTARIRLFRARAKLRQALEPLDTKDKRS